MPTTSLMPLPKLHFETALGTPLLGGKVYTYAAGGNVPKQTFTDAAGTTPHTNPILLNLRGEPPAPIFWSGNYRMELRDALDNLIYTVDNFNTDPAGVWDTLTKLAASDGAGRIGFIQSAVGAVARTLQSRERDSISVFDFMSAQLIADALTGAPVLDHTAAVQAAITHCIGHNLDLEVPGLCRITAPLMIDRQVDNLNYDAYFTILTRSGGGFYVNTAINIFSSTLVDAASPVTQMIRWQNLRFVAESNAVNAYVLDGVKYLRSVFDGCTFSKIKALVSAKYVQSIYFYNCNARRWSGTFCKIGPQGYDIQVIGGLYEAGSGDCFDIQAPIGCKFWTQIEGMIGTALKLSGCQGVDISLYAEANGMDFDCRTGGIANHGINFHGGYISHANATFSVKWGECYGCVSHGNWHTNNMHDLQANSYVEINDSAQGTLSNAGDVVAHMGYRQGDTTPLHLRGSDSDSYTTTGLMSKYTRCGNRVNIDFVATLASTAANPQDTLYIPSLFPFDAAYPGMQSGMVEVSGSSVNNGISPMHITSATPLRMQSSVPVIPANNPGDTWTVRGQLSYQAAT